MADEKDDEIRSLKDRLAHLEGRMPSGNPSDPQPPKKGGCSNAIIAILVLVAGVIVLSQCVGGDEPHRDTTPAIRRAASAPVWTGPDGYSFVPSRAGGVAYNWGSATRAECRGGRSCFAMDVVTEKGCPRSLYVSVKLLNASEQNIGWTNDTAQGVEAGEPVRLVFTTYEEGARTAQVAEVSCY